MKQSKYFNPSKIEVPATLDVFRSRPVDDKPVDERIRCKCGRFAGPSNITGGNGRLNDALRNEVYCDNCRIMKEGIPSC